MSEKNKAIAVKFLTTMADNDGLDESMITDDFEWWARAQGKMTAKQMKKIVADMAPVMPRCPDMTVVGVAGEGDRVAVELTGKCQLTTGKRYDNTYHFLILLRDGKVKTVKEFCDTQLASEVFGQA